MPIITAYPFFKDKTLNIKDIEHGLEQINRLSSNNATMKIIPAKQQEYSKILITNKKTRNITPIDISYNNNGSDSTGRESLSFNMNLENMISLNENIYLSLTRSVNAGRKARRFSNSFYSSFALPFGKYNFDYSFARSEFSLPNTLSNGDILYSFGDTNTHTLKLKRLLLRDSKYKGDFEVSLVRRDIDNFSEVRDLVTKSTTGTRNLTIATATLQNTFYINQGLFIFNPTIKRGLRWFNALNDHDSTATQKAQYNAVSLYSYLTKHINISKAKLNYNLTFNGQYSKEELYGSEQIFVGGVNTVRGFRNSSIGGDKGYNIKNELKYNLNQISIKYLPDLLIRNIHKTSITSFFDYGYVKSNSANTNKGNYISGAGVKLSFTGQRLSTNITYSRSMMVPSSIELEHDRDDGNDMIYIDTSFRF